MGSTNGLRQVFQGWRERLPESLRAISPRESSCKCFDVTTVFVHFCRREETPAFTHSPTGSALIKVLVFPVAYRLSIIGQHVFIHSAKLMVVDRAIHPVAIQQQHGIAKSVFVIK